MRSVLFSVLLVTAWLSAQSTESTDPRAADQAIRAHVPANVPTWAQFAADFPGCDTRKRLGDVVFVGRDDIARRVGFDRAWAITHDHNAANDGWVIGWCG